jgi:hypothetical protein
MSEWWTYRLTSFLLFSPQTYYRTIERYNLEIWPAQLVGVAIGLAIIALLMVKGATRERIIAALLAGGWLWIGWAFHYQRYTQINWVAPWIAAAFALESLLLAAIGGIAHRIVLWPAGREFRIAIALIALIVVCYPLLAPLSGRPWTTAEAFGVAADPTALVTVAILALARGRIKWLLLVIPTLWCLFTVLTLWAMRSPEAVVVAGAALLALAPAATRDVRAVR